MTFQHNYNPDYIHHQNSKLINNIREIVFGMQDGMVSTLGAITGIAIGSSDHYTILLAGICIIVVESVSMGIGSYTSSVSEKNIQKRILQEEKEEINQFPDQEKNELYNIYLKDGWPKDIAENMVNAASANPDLMLHEMKHHELQLPSMEKMHPIKDGLFMFFSYVIGGGIPILPYFFFDLPNSIYISIAATLIALFLLGVATTRYTKQFWLKSGFRLFFLALIALLAGFLVGYFADNIS